MVAKVAAANTGILECRYENDDNSNQCILWTLTSDFPQENSSVVLRFVSATMKEGCVMRKKSLMASLCFR